MKKIAFVLAAAGLMSVAACNKSPEAAVLENAADNMNATADNVRDAAEAKADNMQ